MGEASSIPEDRSIPCPSGEPIRFGTFELDLRACELRKEGRQVKIYGQPYAVLVTLLERPGQMITREELQQKLWPSDTFVDFEHGLNAAINKLREALGDKADNPRYIETLPRRGYRFIGQILPPTAPAVAAEKREFKKEQASLGNARWKPWVIGLGSAAFGSFLVAGWLWVGSSERLPKALSYRQLTTDGQLKGPPPCVSWSRLVTDGPRVYFSKPSATVAQVSVSGGEVIKVATPFPCFSISDISPDKTELLGFTPANSTALDQPLWVLTLATGQAHRVGNIVGRAVGWSPDGQKIAYAAGISNSPGNEVFIASRDGSDERKLARLENKNVITIRWSPDGTLLRLIAEKDNYCTPWEVSADGTNLHQALLLPGREVCEAYWTPDGRYSVLVASRNSPGGPDFWVVREKRFSFFAKVAKPIQLTSGAMGFFDTTISPDGKQLYGIGGQSVRGGLVRYDPRSKRLEPFLSGISAEHLDFSRDGKWVAYVSFPEGTLWKSTVDGKERMQLTQRPLSAVLPRWSPDGKSIVFAGTLPNFLYKIYVVSADGGQPKVVSEGPDHRVNPTWMLDGKTLVFGESQFAANPKIYVLDLPTGKVSVVPGSEGLYDPFVSPDGRFILGHDTPGNHKIMLFSQQTQKWAELFDSRRFGMLGIGYPQWSSDGKYVYGMAITAGTHSFSLYRISMASRKVDRTIAFEIPGGAIGTWGPWIGLTPDGSQLMLRDLSSQEIYAIDVDLP